MSQITQTFVGAEIDGTTLRVVRLEGRTVVYYEKFRQLNSSAVASIMHQYISVINKNNSIHMFQIIVNFVCITA